MPESRPNTSNTEYQKTTAWLRQHWREVAIGAMAALAAVWYLFLRGKGSSSSTGTTRIATPPGSSASDQQAQQSAVAQDTATASQALQSQAQQITQQLAQMSAQQQQNLQAAVQAANDQYAQMAAQNNQVVQQQQQGFKDTVAAALQAFQQNAQQAAQSLVQQEQAAQNNLNAMLSAKGILPNGATGPLVSVPYAGGGTAQVPQSIAQAGSQGGSYVAGTQPATWDHPAGGGVWNGQSDQQIQQAFIKAYGSVQAAQEAWQKQHGG